jgi:glycosyltransferase involved in cell wall biosynthesis
VHTSNASVIEGDLADDAACRRAAEGAACAFDPAAIPGVPCSVQEPLDWLQNSPASKESLAMLLALKGRFVGGARGRADLLRAYRLTDRPALVEDLETLDERFTFVLSTGWSTTDYSLVALAARSFRSTVFIQACNYAEIPRFEAFSPRIRCLPTIACDWINPGFYEPRPFHRREIDFLMVANWAPLKRHWHFFRALARMPRDLRVAMIGQVEGPHTLESVRAQARLFGVRQEIEFRENLPIEEVQEYQCDSKVSLILSRREGCCVAVVESLFADSPVALLKDAHVGPRAYINDQIGLLLEHSRLDRQLGRFLEGAGQCRARAWAVDNI